MSRAALLALVGAILALTCSEMASAGPCGVTASTSGTVSNYNPFAIGGLNQTLTLNLTRRVEASGTTRRVNFLIVRPAGVPAGIDLRYQGVSVLYSSATGAALNAVAPPAGTVLHDFGGQGLTNFASLSLQVVIPAGLNLTAGQSIRFDIAYVCTGSGTVTAVTQPQTIAQAINLLTNVQSALQASYAGATLDFGEIGQIADAQASTRVASGAIRVASSGPFLLTLSSANDYRMTYSGGDPGNSRQSVRYSATLAGQTRSTASPAFVPVACSSAGTAGQNVAISTRLIDGGSGRTPAPDYRDTLTVTVTPTVALVTPVTVNCSGL